MNAITVLSNSIGKLEKFIVTILIPIMLVSMFMDVLFRYIFNSPLVWAQEISLYAFIWASFIGGSMTIKTKEAIAVSIITDRLKGKSLNVIVGIGLFISSIFSIYLCYLSIHWISNPTILMQKSVTTQIPMIIPYLCIPIGITFMAIHFIDLLLKSLRATTEEKVT